MSGRDREIDAEAAVRRAPIDDDAPDRRSAGLEDAPHRPGMAVTERRHANIGLLLEHYGRQQGGERMIGEEQSAQEGRVLRRLWPHGEPWRPRRDEAVESRRGGGRVEQRVFGLGVVGHGLSRLFREARITFMSIHDIAPRPMTLDEFVPMIGQILLADCNPSPAALELVSAKPLTNHGLTARPPFHLVFRSAPEVLLLPGVYAMRCGEWGPDAIYIEQMASLGFDAPGHYYQAVFN
ncbi:DUF6916 family protein [Methylosinus trichosporium]